VALVSGSVRDAVGAPVAGARVAFADAPVAVPDVALLTDAEGRFALAAPAPGGYELSVAADGYAPAHVAVEVPGSEPVDVAVTLLEEVS
jgi:protocatechuate 3,4-dioxygenase beta subunit